MHIARVSSANRRLRPTGKKCFSILCLLGTVVVAPSCVYRGIGKGVRTDLVKFFDASTDAPIQEVLVIRASLTSWILVCSTESGGRNEFRSRKITLFPI
jgi:hypothetical protein